MNAPVSEDTAPRLTNWSNEPTLQSLKQDLENAKPAHDAHLNKVRHWNDLSKIQGKARPEKIKGRSSVQPKLIRRQAEWRYSALSEPFLGSQKLWEVRPVTAEDGPSAAQNELVLNHQFKTVLNRVKLIDDYVRVTVDEGSSILRLGWKRVTVTVKEEVPVFSYMTITTEEEAEELKAALLLKKEDPRGFEETSSEEIKAAVEFFYETQKPTVAQITGSELVDVEKVLENHPTVEVLNPENVYIDPSCNGDFLKAQFAVISFETSKADLKKEGDKYKNLDLVDWENAGPIYDPDHATQTPTDFQFKDAARKRVVAYEYWGLYDINGDDNLVPIVATWIGNTLIRLEKNPFPDEKIPLVVVPYLPVKRELMGETDAELLEDPQKILGAVTRGMIDLLGRSANGQMGFAKGMLDPLNRRKFENGQDYDFNPALPPSQGLIQHTYPEIPTSALTMLQLQNQEAESLTGVKSFGGGISGDAYGEVAAGIRGVLDAASKREMAILRRLAKGMMEVGQKIASMNAAFLSEKEVVRITNTEFVVVLREDLKGNFDFNVDISTAEVDDAQAKDLAFMLQTLGPKGDPAMVMMILSEIARLKRMPQLSKMLKDYKPTPDPLAEKLKELEIAKVELEIQKLQSEVELNNAKAAAARATAEQTGLDTIEQATGTAHSRDLENTRAQAQGNQDLTITKALASPKKEGETPPDIEAAVGFRELSRANGDDSAMPVDTTIQRDELAQEDPRYSLGSRFYDPSLDPSLNPNVNI